VVNGDIFLSAEASIIIQENKDTKIPIITRREKEVLLLIAEDLINNQIAEKLFISATTVDSHRNSLLSKFEIKNTANLIRLAAQYNFI
jgi:DNA-binding CsgD family transcriptional regulator